MLRNAEMERRTKVLKMRRWSDTKKLIKINLAIELWADIFFKVYIFPKSQNYSF